MNGTPPTQADLEAAAEIERRLRDGEVIILDDVAGMSTHPSQIASTVARKISQERGRFPPKLGQQGGS